MSKAIWRAWLLCLSLAALVACLPYPGLTVHAQSPADPKPQLVYQNPKGGDVLRQPAFGIQLCFASPINIKDLDAGGDFQFAITEPDGFGLGNRDVFQPDGYGVTVYPGAPPTLGETVGKWKFHYRVTSPDAKSALEAEFNYTVDPDGQPVPQETPPPCIGSVGTATAAPGSSGSTTSTSGGSNTLIIALIAGGVAGAVGILAIILWLVGRRRRPARRPTPGSIGPIAWSPPKPSTSPVTESRASMAQSSAAPPPPVVASGTPSSPSTPPPAAVPPPTVPWSRPSGSSTSMWPPPDVESKTPLPESSPPPNFAPPPPSPESGTTSAESRTPPGFAPPPPIAESGTPLPESRPSPSSATPTEDFAVDESADYNPDNSKYALLAIGAAVILLIGIIFRRRGRRDRRHGVHGKDD